jgi:hypothetical protein
MIDAMEHESGLGPNKPTDPGDWVSEDAVRVVTDAVQVTALPIHDLPHEDVMAMLAMPQPYQTVKRMSLFKLAMVPGDDADRTDLATFGEMWTATNEWVSQSNKYRLRLKNDAASGQSPVNAPNVDFT